MPSKNLSCCLSCQITSQNKYRASEKVQFIKALTAKLEYPNLTYWTHMEEGKNQLFTFVLRQTDSVCARMHTHTCTIYIYIYERGGG